MDFALVDVGLFLDINPTNAQALQFYKQHKALKDQLVAEYTNKFGPLTLDNVNVENRWTWTECPWPWQLEG